MNPFDDIDPIALDAADGARSLTDTTSDTPQYTEEDVAYMRECMALAHEAEERDEVPVGAIIVRNGQIIARASNTRESTKCATHHAEILAIEEACRTLGGWRLIGCTLYVSMEPCAMCAGAIINSRIERVVYGTRDIRFGAFGSLIDLARVPLNHSPCVVGGVLEDENKQILSDYFKRKRQMQKEAKTHLTPDLIC